MLLLNSSIHIQRTEYAPCSSLCRMASPLSGEGDGVTGSRAVCAARERGQGGHVVILELGCLDAAQYPGRGLLLLEAEHRGGLSANEANEVSE